MSDEHAGKEIIEKLTQKQLGTADLLITPTSHREAPSAIKRLPKSAIGWAADFIKVTGTTELENCIKALLLHTLVVPDLETAFLLRPTLSGVYFVTLAGEVLSPLGFLKGGQTTEKAFSTLRLQNEVHALETAYTQKKETEAENQNTLSRLSREIRPPD